jgi:hypothetical protein
MSWDFIVPIGTIWSSADIDSWNASSLHPARSTIFYFSLTTKNVLLSLCIKPVLQNKFGLNSSSAANPAAAHPLSVPSISYRAT